MEVDHHKGLHPCHFHVKSAEEAGRGGAGPAVSRVAEVEEVEEVEGEAGTQYNFTEIYHNFCLTFFLFHFSKNVFIRYQIFLHHLV